MTTERKVCQFSSTNYTLQVAQFPNVDLQSRPKSVTNSCHLGKCQTMAGIVCWTHCTLAFLENPVVHSDSNYSSHESAVIQTLTRSSTCE